MWNDLFAFAFDNKWNESVIESETLDNFHYTRKHNDPDSFE